MVDWIVRHALPARVPAALRRAHSHHSADVGLETPAETQARVVLEELERRYIDDRTWFQADLERARQETEPVRSGLLYGSSSELADVVAVVLRAAGFTVTDLDAEPAPGQRTCSPCWARIPSTRRVRGRALPFTDHPDHCLKTREPAATKPGAAQGRRMSEERPTTSGRMTVTRATGRTAAERAASRLCLAAVFIGPLLAPLYMRTEPLLRG